MARKLAVLTLIGSLVQFGAHAAYVQWVRCPDGRGGTRGFEDLWPTSSRARLLPANGSFVQNGGARLEFDIKADYVGDATCIELLEGGPSDVNIRLEALDRSETYTVRPSNWSCLSYSERPALEQK
jgi:hypothetical protein